MKNIFRHWKIIYVFCSFIYMVWIIQVGDIEFDRINTQYRSIVARLDTGRIKTLAIEELTAGCLRESKLRAEPKLDTCVSWQQAVIEAKGKEIEKRLRRAQKRGFIKVVMFYAGFVLLFLLGPPLFIYLLLIGAIRIYKSVKFVRSEEELKSEKQ